MVNDDTLETPQDTINRYRAERKELILHIKKLNKEVSELQDQVSDHVEFLDKHHKGWEDVWNNEQLEKEKKAPTQQEP